MSETLLTDHAKIRWWVEEKGGRPAVKHEPDETSELTLDFPKEAGDENLEPISWNEFFRILEEKQLAVLAREELVEQASGAPVIVPRHEAKVPG